MKKARPYQQEAIWKIPDLWNRGVKNVLYVLPTGGGKTFILSQIITALNAPVCVNAHRSELILQISNALGSMGVYHRIIGPDKLTRVAQQQSITNYKACYVDPRANVGVASVQTLRNRSHDSWIKSVKYWITDEAHHLQPENQWGQSIKMFRADAFGLGVTATPKRADGKPLGTIFDEMVVGPSPRYLINQGYLCDYEVIANTAGNLYLDDVNTGSNGDWVRAGLKKAVRRSTIVGDVVAEYIKHASGKLGVTFSTDIETAGDLANDFRKKGVPAEVLSSKTEYSLRTNILKRFANREILQLVTVDIVSEGFDLPAMEVASMARPTKSLSLFLQQFGRPLRTAPGKDKAIIIDHVGNTLLHKPPEWSWSSWELTTAKENKKKKKEETEVPPITRCTQCARPYEAYLKKCPHCGFICKPAKSSKPREVAGDLSLLTKEALEKLFGRIEEVEKSEGEVALDMRNKRAPEIGVLSQVKRHRERKEALSELKKSMMMFGGHVLSHGLSRLEGQKLFCIKYGLDVLSAQGLDKKEAEILNDQITKDLEGGEIVYKF